MPVVLPTPENNSGTNDWSDVYSNDKALKEAVEALEAEFKASVKPVTWYTPKVIETEEARTNTAFGTLTTADEITGVVLPTNGLISIKFAALVKSSVSSAGRVAIFLGSNQIANLSALDEASTSGLNFHVVASGKAASGGLGLEVSAGEALVSTGIIVAPLEVFAAAGTYAVSVKYKATSGSITAKERKLWVEVHGF